MNNSPLKYIFFDLDNTLWDHIGNSEKTLALLFKEYRIREQYDITFEEWHDVFYHKNERLWERLRDGEITKEYLRLHRFKDAFEYFDVRDEVIHNEFEEYYLDRMGRMSGLVPGAVDLLQNLKNKGYSLHVITNGFEEVSWKKIQNSALNGWIETLSCADEAGKRKPNREIFDLAMTKAGATYEESLIIGDDWLADIIGGTRLGMRAIYFNVLKDQNQMEGVPVVLQLPEIKALL